MKNEGENWLQKSVNSNVLFALTQAAEKIPLDYELMLFWHVTSWSELFINILVLKNESVH